MFQPQEHAQTSFSSSFCSENPYRKAGGIQQSTPSPTTSTIGGGNTTSVGGVGQVRGEVDNKQQGEATVIIPPKAANPFPIPGYTPTHAVGTNSNVPGSGNVGMVEGMAAKEWLMPRILKFCDWCERTEAGRSTSKTQQSIKAFRSFDTVISLAAAHRTAFNANPDLCITNFLSKFQWERKDFTDAEWDYIIKSLRVFLRFAIDEILEHPKTC